MKDIKGFLKKNKHTVVVLFCCLLLTILVFFIKFAFFPNDGKAVYGDRLNGISDVKINNAKFEQIQSALEEKEEVKTASVSVSGRILDVMIVANDDVSVDTAKTFTDKVVEALEEDQKKYYDIQVFISKTNGDEKFPIIGYRHKKNDYFSWTKDR